MAKNFIKVNRAKQAGNATVRLAELVSEVQKIAGQIINMGQHTIAASDYTMLEDVFGLQAGDGAALAALVTDINKMLNTTDAMSGAERVAALSSFTGRVGLQ